MKPFKIEKKVGSDEVKYLVSGYIDEHALFPCSLDAGQKIKIDLSAAEGMNSLGTKNWCLWMENLRHSPKIEIQNCPPLFIKAFNVVLGSLPSNANVTSFYVPYISTDGTGQQKNVLFKNGVEITSDGQIRAPKVFDKNNQEMEMDTHSSYFNFIKR